MTTASVSEPVIVTVVGIGNAGLPLAARAANAGHRVWGLDTNPDRVARVEKGIPPVDTVTAAELAAASPRLTATGDPACLESSQIIVLCVPTPLDDAGHPDLCPLTDDGDVRRPLLVAYAGPRYCAAACRPHGAPPTPPLLRRGASRQRPRPVRHHRPREPPPWRRPVIDISAAQHYGSAPPDHAYPRPAGTGIARQ